MLVDRDIVSNLGTFTDHAKPVIEKEALADLGAGMNIDGRQEARGVVDEPREEEEPPLPQPVTDPVESQCRHSRIEEHVPARTRRRIARFDRIQIGDKP